jgi:hypothetical protein
LTPGRRTLRLFSKEGFILSEKCDLQDSRCVLLDHKTVTFDKQLTTVVKRCMCHSTRL